MAKETKVLDLSVGDNLKAEEKRQMGLMVQYAKKIENAQAKVLTLEEDKKKMRSRLLLYVMDNPDKLPKNTAPAQEAYYRTHKKYTAIADKIPVAVADLLRIQQIMYALNQRATIISDRRTAENAKNRV